MQQSLSRVGSSTIFGCGKMTLAQRASVPLSIRQTREAQLYPLGDQVFLQFLQSDVNLALMKLSCLLRALQIFSSSGSTATECICDRFRWLDAGHGIWISARIDRAPLNDEPALLPLARIQDDFIDLLGRACGSHLVGLDLCGV